MNDLSDATVMVFAGTAARGSAIPSPVEGMVTYLSDVNQVQAYNGAAFAPIGTILEVVSTTKTDAFSASVAAGSNVAVTGLSITHEVQNSSNKVLLSVNVGAISSSGGEDGAPAIALYDGTNLIGIGDADGSKIRVGSGGRTMGTGSGNTGLVVYTPTIQLLHTPGSGSKTYTVQLQNVGDSTFTLYANRAATEFDDTRSPRAASSFTLMEVAG
jgi:hypothetical protein